MIFVDNRSLNLPQAIKHRKAQRHRRVFADGFNCDWFNALLLARQTTSACFRHLKGLVGG